MNWYKNHTVYEFVIYNLYNNFCMNLYKKKMYELVQKPHRVRIRNIQFV